MGLFDNNKTISTIDRKQYVGTSAHFDSLAVGNLVVINNNTNLKYRTAAVTIKATLADADGNKEFNWYIRAYQNNNSIFKTLHTLEGFVFATRDGSSDNGSLLTLDELHDYSFNKYNATVYERTFYVDISNIEMLYFLSKSTNSNISVDVSYVLYQERLEVLNLRSIQPLYKKRFTTTTSQVVINNHSLAEVRQFLPEFKFVFVVVRTDAGIPYVLKVKHTVENLPALPNYNTYVDGCIQSFSVEDSVFTTDWLEIKGRGCRLNMDFTSAPESGKYVDVIIYGVR